VAAVILLSVVTALGFTLACLALWHVRPAWFLDAAETLADLRVPPGNRLEKLRGDREGQYSIRINQQWRICFSWSDAGPEDVRIVDYH
jgi:proteic killer suppression protein